MKQILKTIQRKGVIEFMVSLTKMNSDKFLSVIKIAFLRLRGYRIDYSVTLRGNNFFFQSTYGAINIEKNSTIGKGTRISGGGDGEVHIGKNVLIDDHTFIMAHERISIGSDSKIAGFCYITDFNHNFADKNRPIADQGYTANPVLIGKNVWLGTHAIILPGVKIGDGSVIGAGSVVTKSVPPGVIAVGNPAKVIKKIKSKK